MKVLQLIPSLNSGGGEKFTIDLCNSLSFSCDVSLCVLYNVTENMIFAENLNSKVNLTELGKSKGFDFMLIYRIYKLIKREKPDIIHTHLRALTYLLPILFLSKLHCVHTIHNLAQQEEPSLIMRKLRRWFYRFNIVRPICISKTVQASFEDVYDLSNSTLIENGTPVPKPTNEMNTVRNDILKLRMNEQTLVFLNVARISLQKNHILLVKAFNQLYAENKNVILIVLGEESDPTLNLLETLNKIKSPNIHFLGLKKNIPDYLINSDAFCLSSLFEGLPISLLESMALGVIPICTPVGGIPDVIINGKNGILTTDLSIKSYVEALNKFISMKKEEKNTISKSSISSFVNRYNISHTTKNYFDYYTKVINH